jgi:hypothetical protein
MCIHYDVCKFIQAAIILNIHRKEVASVELIKDCIHFVKQEEE